MAKTLESVKPYISKARNLMYSGRYAESVNQFTRIVSILEVEVSKIQDKYLVDQWNKLIDEMKYQKELTQNMIDILAGNPQSKKPTKKQVTEGGMENVSRAEEKSRAQEEPIENKKQRFPFGKQPFRNYAHQDDEVYNKKEKERLEKEQRQRQFQEREAQIWPKKQPAKAKKQQANQNLNRNKSGVNNADDKRDYSKPWLANCRKPGQNKDQKKSFLKHCYPDGSGPDSDLINMLEREVIDFSPNITFEDIAELEKAKDVLEQAVLLPLAMPQLFTGIRRAWKGVLLFGPPGTGKTLLAKAIASTGKTTFFNVTASSLASKWRGQSEKLVRLLFEMAKFYAPATVFIDEIDALASKRSEKQDQANRKVKTELMTRIDGASTGAEEGKLIVVVGATNRPWDLDEAIRRRLEKRIYIPLPTQVGRREMIRINLKNEKTEELNIQEIIQKTEGYSGADIANLCREAAYMPMRRKLKKAGGLGKKLGDGKWMQEFQKQVNVPLTMQDFQEAIKNVKPSVGKGDLARYDDWMKEFGEQGTKI